jgi:hypothetical protein
LDEMLPHETREPRSPTEPRRHQHHPSALQQSPEQGLKDIMEHNPAPTYRGEQHMSDPARLLPMYTTQSHVAVPHQSSLVSPLLRRNKAHVASACVNCKKAHLACDGTTSPTPFLVLSIYEIVSNFLLHPSYHACNQPLFDDLLHACQAAAARRRPIFSDFFLFENSFIFLVFLRFLFPVWLPNWG